jgi:hypothetical protein
METSFHGMLQREKPLTPNQDQDCSLFVACLPGLDIIPLGGLMAETSLIPRLLPTFHLSFSEFLKSSKVSSRVLS